MNININKIFLLIIFSVLIIAGCNNDKNKTQNDIQNIEENGEINISVEEIKYIESLRECIKLLSDSLNSVQEDFSAMKFNKSLLSQSEWQNSIRGEFIKISLTHEMLREVSRYGEIPKGYESLHLMTEDAFSSFIGAGKLIVGSFNSDSSLNTDEVNQLIAEGNKRLEISNKLLMEKVNEHNQQY